MRVDSEGATIDVVADIKTERVCRTYSCHSLFVKSVFWLLISTVLTQMLSLVGCSLRRQWVCGFCYMQGCSIEGNRGYKS